MSQSKKINQLLYKSINKLFKDHRLLKSIPVVIGDSIFISNYVIVKEDHDYSIFDVDTEKCIGVCQSKDGAIAYTRNEISKSGNKNIIKDLDETLSKAENDVRFYMHSLKNTEDDNLQSSTLSRLEESKAIILNSKSQLRDIIFHYDK